MKRTDVVIVGGGPAGMAAAIWCKRLSIDHWLIESQQTLGGQLFDIHNEIVDYPGLQAENGHVLQEIFSLHVRDMECAHQVEAQVLEVDWARRILTVKMAQETTPVTVHCRGLILATGSSVRRLGVRGEAEMIARGEVYSAARDSALFAGKKVAVVGGGDRAVEGALLLAENGAEVVLIHRSDRFRARSSLLQPVMQHPNIQVLTFATVKAIEGERAVEGIRVQYADGQAVQIPVEALFVRIGVEPNSRLLQGLVETDPDGYIVTDATGQTSCPGVFAIGDVCTRPLFSSIASAVGQGMLAAKQLSLQLGGGEEGLR